MLRLVLVFVLGTATFSSPAHSYESHRQCIQMQIVIYDLQKAIAEMSRNFGIQLGNVGVGESEARLAHADFKSLKSAAFSAAKSHSDYCQTLPVLAD